MRSGQEVDRSGEQGMSETGISGSVDIRRPGDVSAGWLTGVLQDNNVLPPGSRVASVATTPIGTGQMSENHRIAITYDGPAGPAGVVLKVAATDERSRRTGAEYGAYEREVRFYDQFADPVHSPVARCLYARIEPETGWFTLLLEDLHPAEQGDQIAGCSIERAQAAIDGLATIHAAHWDEEALIDTGWLTQTAVINQALLGALLPGFEERYIDRMEPAHLDVCRRFVASSDGWMADPPRPFAFVHGDYRLDNLLFPPDDAAAMPTVVDWQTVSYGPAMYDLSYFLGGSLTVADRRIAEEQLVRRYHERLVSLGVTGFAWEDCWREYRRLAFGGILMAIAGSMLAARTDRGDEMFMVTVARHAQHVLDVDALALLPDPAGPEPITVQPADEQRHTPDDEPLWNESWYCDFFTDEGGIAGYTRLGLYPNRDEAWLTIALVQAGRPSVMAVDLHVPLPSGPGSLAVSSTTSDLHATHRSDIPLERFSVSARGNAVQHEDPAAVFGGAPGTPVTFSFDLAWTTVGVPYQYRITPRYEIPCTVNGTVTIGEEQFTVHGRGQRDHSWGTRDWWAMDWCWMAGQLDDGTMFHGTELRLPDLPRIGIGYVQSAGGAQIDELAHVNVSEERRADGLIGSARATLGPPDLGLDLTAVAHGPLLLTSDDGRVAQFPRALYRVRTPDGRTGLAWTEFNLNQ
jgi:Phosphotransferase enzyme family